jgi:hypothetical protein
MRYAYLRHALGLLKHALRLFKSCTLARPYFLRRQKVSKKAPRATSPFGVPCATR